MNTNTLIASVFVLFGCLAVGAGLFNNTFYSEGESGKDMRIPTWQGRTLFLLVGSLFVVLGIVGLFNGFPSE
ncbi:MAG TPA: hypothetical protein VIM62_07070 [Acidobacteriaceae bacterium]